MAAQRGGAFTELDAADAYCRHLVSRHYENFSVTSRFLPSHKRLHLDRIYAFCRTTDELGDESHLLDSIAEGADADTATRRLDSWRDQLLDLFSARPAPIHPVLIALRETIAEFGMAQEPFVDLISANAQDQEEVMYETWEELREYCMLSAAPVGRMVLSVFGVTGARPEKLSDDVCIGLQFANHAQDVKRDAEKGRRYLPEDELRRGGISHAVRTVVDRAETLLMSGRELEAVAPFPLRAQLMLYRLGGMEVVKAIRALGYRTDLFRPQVGTVVKMRLLSRVVLESMSTMGHATPERAA